MRVSSVSGYGSPRFRLDRWTITEERRDWILNEEGLYNWARREGVRL